MAQRINFPSAYALVLIMFSTPPPPSTHFMHIHCVVCPVVELQLPAVIPNLAKHLAQPQTHFQDLTHMPTTTTATSPPGKDALVSSLTLMPISSTKTRKQTRRSCPSQKDGCSVLKQTERSLNRKPAASNKNTLSMSQGSSIVHSGNRVQPTSSRVFNLGQPEVKNTVNKRRKNSSILLSNQSPQVQSHTIIVGPDEVSKSAAGKPTKVPSGQQLTTLLTLAQSIPLSSTQVSSLLQCSQVVQTSNKCMTSHATQPSLSPSLPYEDISQGAPSAQASGRTKFTSCCLNSQPTSSSSVAPSKQEQPIPLPLSQVDTASAVTKQVSSSELTQPVPLEVLIQHKILNPRPNSLTCTVLVSV